MSQTVDLLTTARDAASRQSWREAFEAHVGLEQAGLGAEDLERYGEAAWWSGKLLEAIRLREEAYAAFARAGSKADAARVALTLSWDESNRGAFSVAQGWFSTADRQLEGEEESAVHGRIALTRAATAMLAEGDYPKAIANLGRAYEQNDGAANPYGGGAVHLAARIGAAAGAGEILASHETVEGAGTGFRTSEPRPQAFKGFAEPVDVISVDWK